MARRILHLEGVHKRFGPVHALRGVELDVYEGEVHALIGENGAGKSTLMKILSGAHPATEGRITLNDRPYTPARPNDGRRAGVAMIYQELTLAPDLSIEQNIMLGMEQHRWGFAKNNTPKIRDALALLGHPDLSPQTRVGSLKIGTQQLIEIARAIVSEAKIIIMDEPTSSLSSEDTRRLFEVIRKLRDQGIAVIYISHFLEEVQEIADRYTVLRDGETVGTGMMDGVTVPQIIEMMVGRSLDEMYPRLEHEIGEVALRCGHVSGQEFPTSASLQLRRGEILGVFGLVGAGRSEMLRCLFGLDPMIDGEVALEQGRELTRRRVTPGRSLAAGLDLLSEDRKQEGLAQSMTIVANTTLSSLYKSSRYGFIDLKQEKVIADRWADRLGVKCHTTTDPISTLSGGNQQKVAIGRLMNHDSDIFFLDEPTRGIDVGSKSEIYLIIQELAAAGKSIIIVSSYLPELQGVCDSLAVMYRGRLSPVRAIEDWTLQDIMGFATTGEAHAQTA
ncbi:sugar ABC transporter ATP-binding protein [Algisphaera agarilytica]|uniref:Ribose transport system ATP-binding protein n=1 Tax=Algisphaera agarilytica TaxID=1385975 RepID=A0A7X0LK35_9BACT|nr:sugar ABC transporter ATP-binding protein [Algisphaera agarilytica]MBB6429497.1 ribose transport system ATP-binding protein [Algisphaera agarilytica]